MIEKIIMKKPGRNGLVELRNQLDHFVSKNFDLLYEGASRLGLAIPADHYAPRRVRINETSIHETKGLVYASRHNKNSPTDPTSLQLRKTIRDIQTLIDAASEVIPPPFTLNIIENEGLER